MRRYTDAELIAYWRQRDERARKALTEVARVLTPSDPSAFQREDFERRIATARTLIARATEEDFNGR